MSKALVSMNKKDLIELRRKHGEALKAILKAEASAQRSRKMIEDQLFEIEERINLSCLQNDLNSI